jgi:hypothetical protein
MGWDLLYPPIPIAGFACATEKENRIKERTKDWPQLSGRIIDESLEVIRHKAVLDSKLV